jgi:hypothetical protein
MIRNTWYWIALVFLLCFLFVGDYASKNGSYALLWIAGFFAFGVVVAVVMSAAKDGRA